MRRVVQWGWGDQREKRWNSEEKKVGLGQKKVELREEVKYEF